MHNHLYHRLKPYPEQQRPTNESMHTSQSIRRLQLVRQQGGCSRPPAGGYSLLLETVYIHCQTGLFLFSLWPKLHLCSTVLSTKWVSEVGANAGAWCRWTQGVKMQVSLPAVLHVLATKKQAILLWSLCLVMSIYWFSLFSWVLQARTELFLFWKSILVLTDNLFMIF